jgi:hypothetical protein
MEHLPRRLVEAVPVSAKPLSVREKLMISTSRFILRGAMAAAVAMFASHHFGTTSEQMQ